MKSRCVALAPLCFMLLGCAGILLRVHITAIDISPRTLPPEGGEVKIVVKTYNADHVWVSFKRTSDGKTFTTSLSPEFWLGFVTGEQKWDGEIKLPPNSDPEGKDQVYAVTVKAWTGDGWEHARDGGKVIVKGKPEDSGNTEPR
ncbi:MAG: hypothetical protein RMK89_12135 [Armatimonadota bacterium]|nr:hypothetical protein [Armatimonadota bacterium]MDW8144198.1 hypothetical protein [Armatimonadota bacterium]